MPEYMKKPPDINSEVRVRASVIKTLSMFQSHLSRLEKRQMDLVTEAKNAKEMGNKSIYQATKKKLRLCLVTKKLLEEMLIQLELSLQIDDMDRMIENYNTSMDLFTQKHSSLLRIQNASKYGKNRNADFHHAIHSYAELYDCLSGDDKTSMGHRVEALVSDDELSTLLDSADLPEQTSNAIIDAKLRLIKNKLEEV